MPESSSAPLTRRVIYDRLHYLLRHLIVLIPTLPSTLQTYLTRHFPHKRLPLAAQVTYIRNILRIAEYCPELADRILATIVDRVIQIDVSESTHDTHQIFTFSRLKSRLRLRKLRTIWPAPHLKRFLNSIHSTPLSDKREKRRYLKTTKTTLATCLLKQRIPMNPQTTPANLPPISTT